MKEHERIRRRAYEIWEEEGRPKGRQLEHWHRAERELAGEDATSEESEEDIEAAHDYERRLNERGGRAGPAAEKATRATDRAKTLNCSPQKGAERVVRKGTTRVVKDES